MSISEKSLLGYKLKQTQHALRLSMDEAMKPLKLTTPQYAVLAQLEINPGISNADLARAAFITAQTMHGIVSNLEKRKLVKRKSSLQHGRILCTELTKAGQKLVQDAHKLIEEVENRMTKTISKDNVDILDKVLSECLNNIVISKSFDMTK